MRSMEREGARRQEEYNRDRRASGACPDPITDPLGWCEHEWSKEGEAPPKPRMGWRSLECQPYASPATGGKDGLLVEAN